MKKSLEGRNPEEAFINALMEIGVMNGLGNGWLNIPDLFRIAAVIWPKGRRASYTGGEDFRVDGVLDLCMKKYLIIF